MRHKTLLPGNPGFDVPLRNKYIAAFGDACYMSESGSFGCYYQKSQDACDDAVKIGEVSGNAPYDKGYMCQSDGAGNYTLQIGADVANVTYINYVPAPRQTPLFEIDGMPTEVSGPYRNLTDPAQVGPGTSSTVPAASLTATAVSSTSRSMSSRSTASRTAARFALTSRVLRGPARGRTAV